MKVVGFSEPASYREMEQKKSTVRIFAPYALTFYITKNLCAEVAFPVLTLWYKLTYSGLTVLTYRKCYGLSFIHYDMKVESLRI